MHKFLLGICMDICRMWNVMHVKYKVLGHICGFDTHKLSMQFTGIRSYLWNVICNPINVELVFK